MSGSISRSVSLQSPEEGVGMASSLLLPQGRGDQRPSQGQGNGSSPLQHFVQAKKKINEIFKEVESYVNETERFLVSVPKEAEVAPEEDYAADQEYGEKIHNMLYLLSFN